MGLGHGASIVRSGLVLSLDAANKKSYPGTGTAWTNLVGPEVFTINAAAYNGTGPKYMDFKGSYGCAKKTDSDLYLEEITNRPDKKDYYNYLIKQHTLTNYSYNYKIKKSV